MPIEIIASNKSIVIGVRRKLLQLEIASRRAMDLAAKGGAKEIKKTFIGSPLGFSDRTGSLRSSIKGGVRDRVGSEVRGFISAGDDTINPDTGLPTRDYVQDIEFGEFSRAGLTAFLRPGALIARRLMGKIFSNEIMKVLR